MIHHLATTQHSACGDWKAIQLGGQPPCGLTTSDPSNSPCLTLKREGPNLQAEPPVLLLVSHSARHPADANPVGIPPGCSEDQAHSASALMSPKPFGLLFVLLFTQAHL
eukprot:GGOE01032147.1.p2 GENE.GGOE01032147.1~~GGOE01032147.1.p2  ORF type:complete len:109 (+),score=8.91 GGOE01032147.1:741-1067(+)